LKFEISHTLGLEITSQFQEILLVENFQRALNEVHGHGLYPTHKVPVGCLMKLAHADPSVMPELPGGSKTFQKS